MSRLAEPQLEDEQEVDLGRAWNTIVGRWWLPLAGIAVGILGGFLLAAGASKVYRAEAALFLGQPFSPTGNAPVQSLNTNSATVGRIVRSESALHLAAARAGLRVGQLRGHVSTQAIQGALNRTQQTPLVDITVTGSAARKTAAAANALADIVIGRISGYVDVKIAAFKRRLGSVNDQLASIAVRIQALNDAIAKAKGLTPLDQLVLISQLDNAEARRGQLLDQQSETQQLLALAQNVESARVLEKAEPVRTTARSTSNSVAVGAFIGLILGLAAALLWDPVARRVARRPAV